MAEIAICPNCGEYINLETDIYRVGTDIYCKKCFKKIVFK